MATALRDVGGIRLATIEAGAGGRPLLLSHGFTGAKEDFGDWIERFAEAGWWVVAPDLRGHGCSEQPPDEADYSLARFADDLIGLADDLGWDRFALVGHSMGGMAAQDLALRHRGRLDRLVLMDTHHGPVEGLDADTVALGVDVLRTQGLGALLDLLAMLPPAPRAPSDERLRAARTGYAAYAASKAWRCSAAMYAAMAQQLLHREDVLDRLATLDLPVRVVVGAEDRGFVAASRRMAEVIPGADLVVIEDAAHNPQFENPEAWWDAVAGFLGATPAPA